MRKPVHYRKCSVRTEISVFCCKKQEAELYQSIDIKAGMLSDNKFMMWTIKI